MDKVPLWNIFCSIPEGQIPFLLSSQQFCKAEDYQNLERARVLWLIVLANPEIMVSLVLALLMDSICQVLQVGGGGIEAAWQI